MFTTTLPSGSTKPRSHATAKPIADTKPDDGTVYHYCSVQVQGTRRPYAYLTGGLPLKVGDWVELPFGKDDVPRHGQVKAVMDCTRMVAPWPPEQTKTVIRTIDAPAVTPTTEVAAPESQKRVEQRKKAEKVEVPVIFAPETKAEEPKAEPQVTEPVVSEKDEEKSAPPKKPFPLGKIIAAVLAVAVIAGISISVSSRNKKRAAAYEAALQELSNGNYTPAEQGFFALSGYRDAASLSVYCKYADKIVMSVPKTKSSIRKLVLPPAVVQVLKEYRESVHSRWMFPSPVLEDMPLNPGSVYDRLQLILEHANCKQVRFHDLRHTFATLALQNGMDVKTLSAMLGHVSAATTLDIYTHSTSDMQHAAARKIDCGIGKAELPDETAPQANAPAIVDFQPYMGKVRKPGTGCISQINDHLFEGRYSPTWIDGKKHARNIYAHTREECEEKLKTLITQMKAELAELKRQKADNP